MKLSASFGRASLVSVLCGVLAAACAAVPASTTSLKALSVTSAPTPSTRAAPTPSGLLFEVVAEGAPMVGEETSKPILAAINGNDPNRALPAGLPDTAQEALRAALSKSDSALYVVVYAGVQPSSGYAVRINAITTRQAAGREQLVVDYTLEKPAPGTGGATVLTYPFAIVRVSGVKVNARDVVFEGP